MVIYPIFNNINGAFYYEILGYFCLWKPHSRLCNRCVMWELWRILLRKKYTNISVNTSINEANNVKFYSEKVETNNDKKLITLVKEVKENCYNQHKSSDWIKLVGITPVINDEIAEVIDSLDQINS